MAEKLGTYETQVVTWIIVAVAALNWAVVEFAETDLLVDTLGLSGQSYTAVIAVIGVAATVNLYNLIAVELGEM